MREIGSEFWTKYGLSHIAPAKNETYLLSGRTALRYILDDICRTKVVRKVLLPSYCCGSMIQPFVGIGIAIQFYEVYFDHIEYPHDNDADIVLLIDFFGYINPQNGYIARREKQAGKIVIYDATHKLDGNPTVLKYADYSFCSYRKWFYCNFSQAVKKNGVFNKIELKSNNRYIALRNEAACEKEKYFVCLTHEKERFLSMFSEAEKMLDEDYIGYKGEPVVFDINKIASKRRENAAYLINELKKIPEVRLWRDAVAVDDVPMFVPVLLDSLVRNDLRNTLIKENIYCPIHWPKSDYQDNCNELYNTELSLVCDQRYDIFDMERMIQVINNYFSR